MLRSDFGINHPYIPPNLRNMSIRYRIFNQNTKYGTGTGLMIFLFPLTMSGYYKI